MKQFIEGTDEAFLDLERRSAHACVRFRDREMPPGSAPLHADIAFEGNGPPGSVKLLVGRGVVYDGRVDSVREWLTAGERTFSSFPELRAWLRGPLASAFTHGHGPSGSSITDIEAVQEAVRRLKQPLFLDEEELLEELRASVLGQDPALRALASLTARHCARRKPTRPAVGFAVGPSGVGKTKSAEILARILRQHDDPQAGYHFLRIDMSEYQEAHRVSQLLGAPPGYVGHGQGSQLVDALRSNPKTVVLLDEIEKAHPSIFRVFMNAMDAGRLSTSDRSDQGHEIDCTHAIFIFTSNLDSKEILEELTDRRGIGNPAVEDEVCRRRLHAAGIPAEIVGRIGRFLIFQPLSPETRAEIVAMAIRETASEYGLEVTWIDPDVIIEIMTMARASSFGVRPERYLVDECLGAAFSGCAKGGIDGPIAVLSSPFRCEKASASV